MKVGQRDFSEKKAAAPAVSRLQVRMFPAVTSVLDPSILDQGLVVRRSALVVAVYT